MRNARKRRRQPSTARIKDPAAVSLGRRGGTKRWASQDAAERSEEMRRVSLEGWKVRPRGKGRKG